MENYNFLNCNGYQCSYENKTNSFSGNYSGKNNYASEMPDIKMRDYCNN
jgi:hypothetical protein